MAVKHPLVRTSVILLALIAAVVAWTWLRTPNGPDNLRVEVDMSTPVAGYHDLFYDNGHGFSPQRTLRAATIGSGRRTTLVYDLPRDERQITGIRLDLGEEAAHDVVLHSVRIAGPFRAVEWDGQELLRHFTVRHDAVPNDIADEDAHLRTSGNDPYIHTSEDLGPLTTDLRDPSAPLAKPLLVLAAILLATLALVWPGFRNALPTRLPRLRLGAFAPRKRTVILLAADALVMIIVFGVTSRVQPAATELDVRFQVIVQRDDLFQLFLAKAPGAFTGELVVSTEVKGSEDPQWVTFPLPPDSVVPFLRFDPGQRQDSIVLLRCELAWNDQGTPITLGEWDRYSSIRHQIQGIRMSHTGATMLFDGPDPFMTLDLDLNERVERLRRERPKGIYFLAAIIAAVLFHAGLSRSTAMQAVDNARPRDLVFASLLFTCLLLPGLTFFNGGIEPDLPFTEKRILAPYPPIESTTLNTYPDRYEAWYKDHFGFRKALYRWNSWAHVKLLHTSPLPDAVLVGKNGWLFQYNPRVDGDYRGIPLYTFDELERMRRHYEERQRKLADMGIAYYILIPPMSANLHPEHLPDRIRRRSPETWLGQVKQHFDTYSTVPIIDSRAELLEAKKVRPIYFTTDIHWNPYGAYFGYKKTIERIAQDRPAVGKPWPLSDLRFEDTENDFADVAQLLGLDDILLRTVPVCIPRHERKAHFQGFLPAPGFPAYEQPQLYTQADTTLPKLLMMHDSFGIYLREYLSEHFSSSTFIWTNRFRPQAVLQHKPDVVIQEMMEMFVPNMAFDVEPLP